MATKNLKTFIIFSNKKKTFFIFIFFKNSYFYLRHSGCSEFSTCSFNGSFNVDVYRLIINEASPLFFLHFSHHFSSSRIFSSKWEPVREFHFFKFYYNFHTLRAGAYWRIIILGSFFNKVFFFLYLLYVKIFIKRNSRVLMFDRINKNGFMTRMNEKKFYYKWCHGECTVAKFHYFQQIFIKFSNYVRSRWQPF